MECLTHSPAFNYLKMAWVAGLGRCRVAVVALRRRALLAQGLVRGDVEQPEGRPHALQHRERADRHARRGERTHLVRWQRRGVDAHLVP